MFMHWNIVSSTFEYKKILRILNLSKFVENEKISLPFFVNVLNCVLCFCLLSFTALQADRGWGGNLLFIMRRISSRVHEVNCYGTAAELQSEGSY